LAEAVGKRAASSCLKKENMFVGKQSLAFGKGGAFSLFFAANGRMMKKMKTRGRKKTGKKELKLDNEVAKSGEMWFNIESTGEGGGKRDVDGRIHAYD